MNIKISDFGFAVKLQENQLLTGKGLKSPKKIVTFIIQGKFLLKNYVEHQDI